jgi:hypothetical protein
VLAMIVFVAVVLWPRPTTVVDPSLMGQERFNALCEGCSHGTVPDGRPDWCTGEATCDLPALLDRASGPPMKIPPSCILP